MDFVEFKQTPEFDGLTDREKILVVAYIESRNSGAFGIECRTEAILAAYNVKSVSAARRLTYDYFSRLSILQILSSYFGSNDGEVQELIVRAQRNRRVTSAQFQVMTTQTA